MANVKRFKGTLGILTGGGDVPGLNPAIRGVAIRAIHEGYRVIGLRRGWGGIANLVRDKDADNSKCYFELDENTVNRAAREGGTFLHTSRTQPSKMKKNLVPAHLRDIYNKEDEPVFDDKGKKIGKIGANDITPEIVKNLDFLGIDYLVPIGGDDTLSYGVRLAQEGVKVVAIPKTMDNDVPGTDYCLGFSTCVSRTLEFANDLRTAVGSHERFLIMEVMGRNAGFTALAPTIAGAADRCIIPEYTPTIERLYELMIESRNKNRSNYSSVMISEGAFLSGMDIQTEGCEVDAFGHPKLGGIGSIVAKELKNMAAADSKNERPINIMEQRVGYVVRCGRPDSIDAVVPMIYGNLALELIMKKQFCRVVVLNNGRYGDLPIEVVTASKKIVDAERFYDGDRLRPNYSNMYGTTLFGYGKEILKKVEEAK